MCLCVYSCICTLVWVHGCLCVLLWTQLCSSCVYILGTPWYIVCQVNCSALSHVRNVAVKCLTFSTDRPDHLILFRTYVSRTAAGNGRAVLEGVGLDSATITACFTSHPQNEEEAVQAGLTKWKDGEGLQPPTWSVLLKAMAFAKIAQQHVHGLIMELGTFAVVH